MTRNPYVLEDDPSYLGTSTVHNGTAESTNQDIPEAVGVEPGDRVVALKHDLGVLLAPDDREVDEELVLGRYTARLTHDVARFHIGKNPIEYLEADDGDDVRFYDRDEGALLVRGFL